MENLVQYVIVRIDLTTKLAWAFGAVIAQACHATAAVTHLFHSDEYMIEYMKDLDCMHKVVLGINSQDELTKLAEKLTTAGVDHKLWIEQPEDIPTCLVTKPYPKNMVQQHFRKLKLLNLEIKKS